MSTADHAGRPVRSSTPPPARQPGRGDGGALRRLAGDAPDRTATREAARPGASEPTRPVPVNRESTPRPAGTPGTNGATAPQRVDGQRPEGQGAAQRPAGAAGRPAAAPRRSGGRRVRLTVSRIDPWSAMKMSFLLSVALGIALVVMTVVLWTVLDAMGVFDQVNGVVGQVIQDDGQTFDILDFVGFTRVVSLSIVIGVVDVILFTAIATLSAFLYNVSSALVGGVSLTLTDD